MPPEIGPQAGTRGEILPRTVTLDGVRGIAILMVLYHNLNILDTPASALARAIDTLLDRGWIGVQLFFVLSGYLITSILLQTKDAENYFRGFYGRRVLRIFPLYYLTLIFFLLILPMLSSGFAARVQDSSDGVWLWVFLSNWFEPSGRGLDIFPHFWSLAVEEQFYLLWPLLVYAMPPKAVFRTCLALIAAALAIRVGMLAAGFPSESVYLYSVCRMDALAVGGAIAVMAATRNPETVAAVKVNSGLIALLIVGAVITRGYPRLTPMGQTLGYSILAIGCGMFVYSALIAERRPSLTRTILRSRLLTVFGKYSYGIYVLHAPIHLLVGLPLLYRVLQQPVSSLAAAMLYFVVMSAALLGIATVVFKLIEQPFLRMKSVFAPVR
jgi:peptidoglycan/LPS O-acetylase OafA/YrhL